MSYFILTLIFIIVAAALIYATLRILFRKSWFMAWLRGMSGLTLLLLGVVAGLIAFDIYSYRQVTGEKNVATISFAKIGDQRFTVSFSPIDGESKRFEVNGDQWQIDSRIIKWHNILTMVGLKTGFRLDRLNGRYLTLEDERTKPRSVYNLEQSATPVDFWFGLKALDISYFIDARYGSSTYLPMVDGAQFQVNISTSGILARPINSTAREAVALWQ